MKFFWRYLFPPIYGLLIYITIRVLLDTVTGMRWWHRSWQINTLDLTTTMLFSYTFLFLFGRMLRWFDKKWPVSDFSSKRIGRELLFLILLDLIYQNAVLIPYTANTDDGLQLWDVADVNTVPLLYSLILYGIVRSNTFLKAHIASKIQLEKITNDQLQTELKFLKAQYHPHFLFNALNTIYFQMDEDTAAAKKSVEKFSELLRYQLYDQQQQVPVMREIEYLQSFIDLQKIRSSDRLKLNVDFDKQLNGQLVYPLLFLPLVENAFKFVGGDYNMLIKAELLNEKICFRIENSIPEFKAPVAKSSGIGLENLKRRLDLLYPDK